MISKIPSSFNTFYFYKKSNTVFITSSEYCVGKKEKVIKKSY